MYLFSTYDKRTLERTSPHFPSHSRLKQVGAHEGGIDSEAEGAGGDVGYNTLPDEDGQDGAQDNDEEQGEVCVIERNA